MLKPVSQKMISAAAKKAGYKFVRVFGSAVKSLKVAKDIDLVVGPPVSSFTKLSEFIGKMEKIFHKPIDVVQLKSGLKPTLVLEIGLNSIPLWEDRRNGRNLYAELIDYLHAIAEDEILAYPADLKKVSIRNQQRKLNLYHNAAAKVFESQ